MLTATLIDRLSCHQQVLFLFDDAKLQLIFESAKFRANFFEKICMGVYLHGRAGDAAADRFGNAGMKAMDIADAVANVLKEN